MRERTTGLHLFLKTKESETGIPIHPSGDYAYLKDCSGLEIRIVRERPLPKEGLNVRRPSDLAGMLERLFRGKEKEHFYSFILDARNQMEGIDPVSIGSLNATIVYPRLVQDANSEAVYCKLS